MAKTFAELKAGAITIKENAIPESNTSPLVGGEMLNIVEKMEDMDSKTVTSDKLDFKVDKELGKGLSTNDFTDLFKAKLETNTSLSDAEINGSVSTLNGLISGLQNQLDTLTNANTSAVLDTFKEIEIFLAGFTNMDSLTSILFAQKNEILSEVYKHCNDINVDVLYPLTTGNYTLTMALTAIAEKYKNPGVVISFSPASGIVVRYGYKLSTLTGWGDVANWEYLSSIGQYGNSGIVDNLNTVNRTGSYTFYGTAIGSPFSGSGFLQHYNSSVGTIYEFQRATSYTDGITVERSKSNSTWGAWISMAKTTFNATVEAPLAAGLYHNLASAIAASTIKGLNYEISFISAAYEVDTLTVTAGATADGNVVVTLNGVAFTVAVLVTDNTAALVATKLRAATYSGWTVSGTGASVVFTSTTVGVKSAPALNVNSTGVAGTILASPIGASEEFVTYRYKLSTLTGWASTTNWELIKCQLGTDYLKGEGNKNLFDKDDVDVTAGILRAGGIIDKSNIVDYIVSGFTEVTPSANYAMRYCGALQEYDVHKTPIQYSFAYANGDIFRTAKMGGDTHYIRVGVYRSHLATMQVEIGTVFTSYESYSAELHIEKVDGRSATFKGQYDSILPEYLGLKLTALPRKNLFDKSDVQTNVVLRNGYTESIEGWNVSIYIEVLPNKDYYLSHFGSYSECSSAKNVINYDSSGFTGSTGMKHIVTTSNTRYIILCCSDSKLPLCQLELGSVLTEYENYELPVYGLNGVTGERIYFAPNPKSIYDTKFKGLKYISLGDSITNRGQYQPVLSELLGGFGEINNKGVSGRQVGMYCYENYGTNILIEPSLLNQYGLITFMGYANNYGGNTPLGVISDSIGIKEVDTLNVTAGATADGNITITLNHVATTVAVLGGDSIEVILNKISSTVFSNWAVVNGVFTKRIGGSNWAPEFSGGDTGVIANFARTIVGIAPSNTFYAQVKTTVSYLCENCPEKLIVGIGAIQMAGYFGNIFDNPNTIGLTTFDYNEAMRLTCEHYGIPFVDLFRLSGVNSLNAASYYTDPDFIHPNQDLGMVRMAEVIAGELKVLKP